MKIEITCITPVLQAILDFFPDIISFQHVFHLGVGRSQIEWKLKAKTQISVFQWAKIGQNDHSNPYIESTTVLSDTVHLTSSNTSTYIHAIKVFLGYLIMIKFADDSKCGSLSFTFMSSVRTLNLHAYILRFIIWVYCSYG